MLQRLVQISAVCALSLVASGVAIAATGNAGHPCEQIKQACLNAGFVKNEAKQGYGLWVDCINPIMQGTQQPKKADKPLPQVDQSVIKACQEKKPNFGMGKK